MADSDGRLRVSGATAAQVGHLLFTSGVELHELREESSGLEAIFFHLTSGEPGMTSEGVVP